jgi:cyanophycinase
VVAGTSARASILAEHMIAFGTGGATPKQRMSQLSAGLGLLRGVGIDQHFEQRNRYGRLLSLVAQSPSLLGLGVDEDTAAVIDDGSRLEVIGRGAVTVVDGQNLVSIAFVAKAHVSATGVWGGAARATCWSQFDLTIRTLLAHQTAVPGPEVLQARAAEAELRDVPREIASEGLSRAYQRRLRRNRRS